jgi:hypothetical protein
MTTDDLNKAELCMDELAGVAGGSKNIDNPVVQAVIKAFDDTVKAGQAAQAEFYRNNVMGSSIPWK